MFLVASAEAHDGSIEKGLRKFRVSVCSMHIHSLPAPFMLTYCFLVEGPHYQNGVGLLVRFEMALLAEEPVHEGTSAPNDARREGL